MSLENPHITRQLRQFDEIIKQRRIHPARAAKAHLSGTIASAGSCPFDAKSDPSFSRELTDEAREDELGLDAIVSDWMIQGANNMRQHRPPFGLVYSENGFNGDFSDDNMKVVTDANLLGDPFSTFSTTIHHTLAHALEQKRKQIYTRPEGHEAAIYREYVKYAHRNGIESEDPYGIKLLVFAPKVGLRIMEDILAHSQDIDSTSLGRKVTLEESEKVARTSTPLILKLSSFEEKVFETINRFLTEDGGIWKSLKIVENEGKMYYQIKDPILQHAMDKLSDPDTKEELEKKTRGGCPARNRLNGKESAIETLWNWYIDYTVQISRPTPTISR